MNNEHPITPPPELVEQWVQSTRSNDCIGAYPENYEYLVATQAARWGADMELEACCEWLINEGHEYEHVALRDARRPKPPSLKEQALEALETEDDSMPLMSLKRAERFALIRRALESLPE